MIGGAALLSILALVVKIKVLTYQKDKAVTKSDSLQNQLRQQKVRRKLIKENKEKFVSRSAEIVVQLEKEDEEFTGINSLTNPNDRD